MRLAPVPLAFRADFGLAIHNAGESSRTTHGATSAVDACRYFAGLLLGALGGRSKQEILSPFFCHDQDRDYWQRHALCHEIAEIATGSFKQRPTRCSIFRSHRDTYLTRPNLKMVCELYYRGQASRAI
jgi:ADP-ribosyl-[dinitrogen reductase] hydrolase